MKILYLCPDAGIPVLGHKGAAVHVRELIAAFAAAGHQVVLAAPVLNKSPWETPEPVAGTLVHVRLSAGAQGAVLAVKAFSETLGADTSVSSELRRILYSQEVHSELKRRFDADPPDFIYERASLHSTAGAVLARTLAVPLLIEVNAPLAAEQAAYRGTGLQGLAAQAERWVYTQADAILAVSSAVREHIVSLEVEPQKVHVVPNGVNPALFQPGAPDVALRARLALGDGPVLGFVGGLRPWHGVEILPELIAQLRQRHPSLRLVIAGDGQLRPQLERSLHEKGVAEAAIFTGAVSHREMPGIIRQFDVALAPYPPLDHAFYFSPLKVFEYMACGVAVVAANCGQIAEIIRDNETGLLYPPGDLSALTAACHRLLANPKLRFALGQAAAGLIRHQYTWEQNAARVTALVTSLIAAKKSGALTLR